MRKSATNAIVNNLKATFLTKSCFQGVDKPIDTLAEFEKGSYILIAEIRSVCVYIRGFGY